MYRRRTQAKPSGLGDWVETRRRIRPDAVWVSSLWIFPVFGHHTWGIWDVDINLGIFW